MHSFWIRVFCRLLLRHLIFTFDCLIEVRWNVAVCQPFASHLRVFPFRFIDFILIWCAIHSLTASLRYTEIGDFFLIRFHFVFADGRFEFACSDRNDNRVRKI